MADGIAWRETGSGPPLLLINGYAATKDDWDAGFLEALGTSSTVICPDNRGIGDSPQATNGLSIESMAEDSIGLMDSLGYETFAVAGWSMGGFISQALAAHARGRVERLVLLSTDPGGSLAVPRDPGVQQRLFDHSGTPAEQAERLLRLLFPPAIATGVFDQFGDLVAEAQAKLDEDLLKLQQTAMAAWSAGSAEGRLASITAQTLVAAGTMDVVIPPANSERIAAQLPGSWLARFPGAAHAVMAQEPERLGGLIDAFLGR